ncbi:MAG: hypothetical protein H3C47_01640 [Candidatus Cloacimonetes bacterium]|nr:hypothetical protein [Candidatus Cloacimonadota bacterium]
MRLLLQEYLAVLKEEKELESLVSNLVTSMSLDVETSPQKGVRQHGVDLHAVGTDPEDHTKKNFLITIKQGHINRTGWNEGNQGVRSSLDEIIDVYIPTKLHPSLKELPSKIIWCCGGELKAEVTENWNGYCSNNPTIQFELWNGSRLSSLIEKYLLDENIFDEKVKTKMRRTLVVLSDYGYDFSHYKEMLNDILFNDVWNSLAENKIVKEAVKTLSTIPVCLGMIQKYSEEAKNLKHPLIASEFTLLRVWDFIQKNKLEGNRTIVGIFWDLYEMYRISGIHYFNKIYPHTKIEHGITSQCNNSILASKIVFEQIGVLSTLGLLELFRGMLTSENTTQQDTERIATTLKNVINNNGISGSPCFDEMTIDIALAAYFLATQGDFVFIKEWFLDIMQRFFHSYNIMGKGFPVSSNSIEVLIEFEKQGIHTKEDMSSTSSLLALIGYWCVILDDNELYPQLVDFVETSLSHCTIQMWFPAKGIKESLYKKYAANEFGNTEAPIHFPKSIDELRHRLLKLIDFSKQSEDFETRWDDVPPLLPLIASRHFRTPVIPFFWLCFLTIIEKTKSKVPPTASQ